LLGTDAMMLALPQRYPLADLPQVPLRALGGARLLIHHTAVPGRTRKRV